MQLYYFDEGKYKESSLESLLREKIPEQIERFVETYLTDRSSHIEIAS